MLNINQSVTNFTLKWQGRYTSFDVEFHPFVLTQIVFIIEYVPLCSCITILVIKCLLENCM